MIKKISDWTFGSIFRTFGRLIAYLLLGLLIAYGIKYKDSIRWENLLLLDNVYAEETSGYGKAKFMDCTAGMSNSGIIDSSNTRCSEWLNFGTEDSWGGSYPYRWLYNFKYLITSGNYTYSSNREYRISVVLVLNPKYFDDFLQSMNKADLRVEGGTTSSSSSLSSNNIQSGSVSWYVNDYSSNAYWVDLSVKFVPTKDLKSVWINWLFHVPDDYDASGTGLGLKDFQIYRVNSVTYSDISGSNADVTNAINNQTNVINNNFNNTNNNINKVNDSINEINDTLTDNELDSTDIQNELDNLDVDVESFGVFSTFLTLPLTWIKNILATGQSCASITLPLPFIHQNLVLPCMDEFWQKMGALGVLVQACWLGVVGVRIFNGLFLLTVETLSANDNYDQLQKIRSWEL